MADLVMLIGGTGDQSADVVHPCVADKGLWEYATFDASNFMQTDGEPLVSGADFSSGTPSSNEVTISGNFSALSTLVAQKASGSIYAYLSNGAAIVDGYYEVLSLDGTTSMNISETSLDGDTILSDDEVDVEVGGAGNNISTANARMADIDLSDGYNVDVLINKGLTASDNLEIDVSSDQNGKIRYIGTTHTGRGSATTEFQTCANKTQYPVIDCDTYYFYPTCYFVDFISLEITSTSLLRTIRAGANGSVYYKCVISNTNTTSNAGLVIEATQVNLINCMIYSYGTDTTDYAIVMTRGMLQGCYVYVDGCSAVKYTLSASPSAIKNIVVGGSNAIYGFYFSSGDSMSAPGVFSDNIILNFDTAIYLDGIPDTADSYVLHISNNVIWGNGAGSYGIYNSDVGTKEATVFITHNFIGNCTAGNDNFVRDIGTVDLTTNPFTDGSGKMASSTWNEIIASDFWLNDTAGGGALIKNKLLPIDYDLDGTQDNFITGIIQEEITAGGGNVGRGFNRGM